jgi:hypothetical protein
VAVVARPVADAPTRRRPGVRLTALLAVLLLAATAEALDVRIELYRGARRAGAVGAVAGRAYAESRTPSGPVTPLTGTAVTLLPRSEALLERLERLKAQSRESSTAYTAATPAMRKAREAFERELLEAGAPDLTPLMQVDATGGFRIEDVPAGAWVVFGWHSTPTDVSSEKLKGKERGLFQTAPRLRGFQSVTIWLRELTVAGRETKTVELTDRNGWFRGVIEERVRDAVR